MQGTQYRKHIRTIIKNAIRRKFPGLKQEKLISEVAKEVSVAIHARFYESAIDAVASPIWRDDPTYALAFADAQSTKTAQEILNEGMTEDLHLKQKGKR